MGRAVRRHRFETPGEAAAALAGAVARDLARGLAAKPVAVLAVSGGRTPRLFFEALSREELEWARVEITLVDERFVPETSERSNARLVREALMQGPARSARLVPLYRVGCDPAEAARSPQAALKGILERGFDAVVLGLGPDGHTASFFPDGEELAEALDCSRPPSIVPVRAPSAGEPRLTFSASALLRTNGLYLQLEGSEKRAVFERAMTAGPVDALPIRVFLDQDLQQIDVFEC